MPEEGIELPPTDSMLTDDEIVRIGQMFADKGVDKIRVTGGEPTVRKGYLDILTRLGQIDGINELCMTSNALTLKWKMDKLKEAGLTGLNISIDSFVPAKFDFITRRENGLKLVLPNIERALETGFDSLKLNVVLMKGFNDDEILDFTRFALERDLELRFIEFMPFDDNNWTSDRMVKSSDALA